MVVWWGWRGMAVGGEGAGVTSWVRLKLEGGGVRGDGKDGGLMGGAACSICACEPGCLEEGEGVRRGRLGETERRPPILRSREESGSAQPLPMRSLAPPPAGRSERHDV
jgi:hypothetical protein